MRLLKSLDDFSDFTKDELIEEGSTKNMTEIRSNNGLETQYAGEWPQTVLDQTDNKFRLGYTKTDSKIRTVGLSLSDLQKSLAIFGNEGYGKYSVLDNVMYQWEQNNYGMCVIDTKGEISKEFPEMVDDTEEISIVQAGNNNAKGINLFETYTTDEKERKLIISEFINSINLNEGAKMKEVSQLLIKHLIQADTEYTPFDFYKFVSSTEKLSKFIDIFSSELTEKTQKMLESLTDSELKPLQRRMYSSFGSKNIQNITSDSEADISISEAVKTGKSIFVDISNITERRHKEYITALIARQVWAVTDSGNYEPYSLIFDEISTVDSDELRLSEILNNSKSVGLSVIMTAQQPYQMIEETWSAIKNNSNVITTNISPVKDNASVLADLLSVETKQISNLLLYQFIANTGNTNSQEFKSFAKYPPNLSK